MKSDIQVRLSKQLGQWAEKQAHSAAQTRKRHEQLEKELLEAAASGFQEVTDETWEQSERHVHLKISSKSK